MQLLDDFEVFGSREVRFDFWLVRVERSVETTKSCLVNNYDDLLAPRYFAFLIFQMFKSRNIVERDVALGANK